MPRFRRVLSGLLFVAALLAGGAVAIAASSITTGTPQTLACNQTYTATYSLTGASGTVDKYSNLYTTPACPTTITQTVTAPGTTTTTPTTTTTTTTSGSPQPNGPAGTWSLAFADEFNGTALDTSQWTTHDGWTNQNNVTDHASNVAMSGGNAILTLASSSSGAAIASTVATLNVGQFAEARINFAGSGTAIYGWPAWWASGMNSEWPAAGENDIAEGLGTLTVNYHSPSGAHNQGTIPGVWAGGFHTYGIYRASNHCDVYYDGTLVKSYPTDDNGLPETLILTIGSGNTMPSFPIRMLVDYVRVWHP